MKEIRVGVVTISDRCSTGEYVDKSGQLLHNLVAKHLNGSVTNSLVSDDFDKIENELLRMCDNLNVHLLVTTGGTGFSERDITPEVTRKIIEKEAAQLSMAMSLASFQKTKFAALSRAVCGIRKKTLIVNLPGSPKAVEECFMAIVDVLPHAIDLIVGEQQKVTKTHESEALVSAPSSSSHVTYRHICPHKTNTGAADDRNSPFPMISVDEALNTILKAVQSVKFEHSDFKSPINIPEFRASIKDGYAVKADGKCKGVKKVIGYIGAGDNLYNSDFASDECYKINTGAVVPDYATAVVQIEDTKLIRSVDGVETEVEILTEANPGLDIRPVGCDLVKNERLFKTQNAFPDVVAYKALMASVGIPVKMIPHDAVTICILSTGDELTKPGDPLKPGKIYDSNSTMLLALLQQNGFNATTIMVKDTFDAMHESIKAQSEKNLFLICSGSVSMGDKDFLKNVLTKLEYTLHFGRVNMKPGKPMTFASRSTAQKKSWIFGLPGNPTSAFATFHLFVLPALRKYCGYDAPRLSLPILQMELVNKKVELDSRPEYARARVLCCNGKLYAEITDNQMSSRLASIEGADVLLHLPPRTKSQEFIEAGISLKASVLKHHFISEYLL